MMNKPITIIIPCYNDEKYIAKCLDSVVSQIDAEILLEVLVVDDGSTDNSVLIAREYSEKWPYVKVLEKKNGGQGSARNLGVSQAKGEYLYFLDSDDYIDPSTMKKCYQTAINTNADIITFNTTPFQDSELEKCVMQTYRRSLEPEKIYSGIEAFSYMVSNDEFYPPVWLYFYKSNFYRSKTNGFIEGIVYEDTPFSYKLINQASSFVFIENTLHFRRIRKNSTMRQMLGARHIHSNNVGIQDMLDFYNGLSKEQKTPEQISFIKRIVAGNIRTIMLAESSDEMKYRRINEFCRLILATPKLLSSQMFVEWIKSVKYLTAYLVKKHMKRG